MKTNLTIELMVKLSVSLIKNSRKEVTITLIEKVKAEMRGMMAQWSFQSPVGVVTLVDQPSDLLVAP